MGYWPVSNPTAWADVLTSNRRQPYVYCDLFSGINGVKLNTSPLTILGGSIAFDATQAVRRQASGISFVTDGPIQVPTATTDLLFPDGTEILPWAGFHYADGTYDVVPQGRLLMEKVDVADSGGSLVITTDGIDRMESLSRNQFTEAFITVPSTVTTAGITTTTQTTVTVIDTLTGSTPYLATISQGATTELITVTASDSTGGVLTFTRSSTPATFTAGATVSVTADVTIGGLLQDRLPGVTMNLTRATSVLAPVAFNIGDDPATLILEQALAASTSVNGASVGMEAYFDQLGTFTLAPIVDPLTLAPAYNFAEGASSTMTSITRSLSNKGIPNWIIVVSQGSNVGTPLRSDWQDLDPSSPTFLYGTYPTTVSHVTTSTATTQAQVDAMALALGQARLGTFEALALAYLGDPALDAGSVVTVSRVAAGLNSTPYVIQKGTLDLTPSGSSSLTGYSLVSP